MSRSRYIAALALVVGTGLVRSVATVAIDGVPVEGPRAVPRRRLPHLTLAPPSGGPFHSITPLNVTRAWR
jgi:hypothetical protein